MITIKKIRFWIPTLIGILFVILAIEMVLSLNFAPDYISKNHPIPSVVKHYKVAYQSHLLEMSGRVSFHILTGIGLILLGLLQLRYEFQKKLRWLHVPLGSAYLLLGAVTAALGMYLAQKSIGGLFSTILFWLIGVLWFGSAIQLLRYGLAKDIHSHRRWAIRNVFLILGTGLARPLYLVIDVSFPGQPTEVLFPLSNWLGFVGVLLLSQLYIEAGERRQQKTS